jgi:hypothetical protein
MDWNESELGTPIWRAGELAPPGVYVRVDDGSHRLIRLESAGPLPPSFDGHVACYRLAPRSYAPARAPTERVPEEPLGAVRGRATAAPALIAAAG